MPATPATKTPKLDRNGLVPLEDVDVGLTLGDCLDILPTIPDASVDAVISDPPYPEIDRPYGRMTEAAWHEMMREVVRQTRRVLKPKGSAVFILQPNSRKVGSMRAWLFEFQAWCCREWNIVQDAWWWNPAKQPTTHCNRWNGLMRPSVKACIWLGDPGCYRDQSEVLWDESERNKAIVREDRILRRTPSGNSMRAGRCGTTADERGGVTPFNLLPIANTNSVSSAGAYSHGAGTPEPLADWWVRYISPPGGVVADWFAGSGTMALAALKRGRSFIGIERDKGYFEIAERRIVEARKSVA